MRGLRLAHHLHGNQEQRQLREHQEPRQLHEHQEERQLHEHQGLRHASQERIAAAQASLSLACSKLT